MELKYAGLINGLSAGPNIPPVIQAMIGSVPNALLGTFSE